MTAKITGSEKIHGWIISKEGKSWRAVNPETGEVGFKYNKRPAVVTWAQNHPLK